MARRQHLTLTVVIGLIIFFSLSYFFSSSASHETFERPQTNQPPPAIEKVPASPDSPDSPDVASKPDTAFQLDFSDIPAGILDGGSVAPKLENATLKAELGRATWKFLHTMAARFPEKPSDNDRLALKTFLSLFSRLYPCGDCAEHFRKVLAKNPPQTYDRNAVAGWLCHVHNIVNKRLKKPEFDCSKIGDFYDCGCGDDDKKGEGEEEKKKETPELELEKS